MDRYEAEVQYLEHHQAEDCYPPSPVVFYGSSSIRLWDTLYDDFLGAGVVNLGFGGSTLAACAHFFQRLVLPCQPRSLLIYAGDNDLGDGRSADDVNNSLKDMLRHIDESLGLIPVAFLSIKPSPARWQLDAAIRHANDLMRRTIGDSVHGRFIDIYPHMLEANGRPRRKLYAADGLHLSRAGYLLWAEAIRQNSEFLF